VTGMTTHQLNLLAGIGIAACWCAFVVTWLAAENYRQRVPRLVPGLRLISGSKAASM
jgi:hypothetical protein